MLILVGLAVLLVIAILYVEISGDEFGFIPVLFAIILLGIALIAIPINRMEVKSAMREYEATKETIKESRKSDTRNDLSGVERAAIVTKLSKLNYWVKDQQYWNNSLFDIWIPDTVDGIEVLK